MSVIVFDMEWNMGYPREGEAHFDEIIEIGAVKVQDGQIVDTYKEYIRPTIHHVLHHHVRKMLPFTAKELKNAKSFQTVVREFKRWCGPDGQLVSWGNSDMLVLQSNLARYGMAQDLFGECYDLQAAYGYLLQEYTHQYSLKDVVEQFEIEAPEDFHDAANDAYYTALIGLEIQKRFGTLPSDRVIKDKREELRLIHAEEVRKKALEMETAALEEAEPLEVRSMTWEGDIARLLELPECNWWLCPQCGARVTATGWSMYAERGYITRGHCGQHGWQYPYVQEDGTGTVTVSILPAAQKIKSSYFRFGHARGGKKKK